MIDSSAEGLVHDELQCGAFKDGQKFLWYRFRGWQHAGALASGWDNCRADAWG
jgi:hypothetical protein